MMSKFSNDLPVGAILPTIINFDGRNNINLAKKGFQFCDGSANFPDEMPELEKTIKTNWGGKQDSKGLTKTFHLPPFCKTELPLFIRGLDISFNGAPNKYPDPELVDRVSLNSGVRIGGVVGSFQKEATASPIESFTTNLAGRHSHQVFEADEGYFGSGEERNNILENMGQVQLDSNGLHKHRVFQENHGGDKTTVPVAISLNWIIKTE